ncbi:hypothetical protein GCM10023074_09840 [Microbispora amethystogenes]|uniref:Uncharacterized protein n=1 Tax=Microbispora amethystogenes TaxID=1427754 RepID=A0ABQ4FIJ0_9ACTN|nr:hypothetical protein Mam01_47480 [Microbispora amethystogenes]
MVRRVGRIAPHQRRVHGAHEAHYAPIVSIYLSTYLVVRCRLRKEVLIGAVKADIEGESRS